MFDEALKYLLENGGFGYALAIVFGGIAWVFYREARSADQRAVQATTTCNETQQKLYEARLSEAKEMLSALERSATALAALTASVDARTVAFTEMANALTRIQQGTESRAVSFKDQADRLERALVEVVRILTELQRRSP